MTDFNVHLLRGCTKRLSGDQGFTEVVTAEKNWNSGVCGGLIENHPNFCFWFGIHHLCKEENRIVGICGGSGREMEVWTYWHYFWQNCVKN